MATVAEDEKQFRLWDLSGAVARSAEQRMPGNVSLSTCRVHPALGPLSSISWHPTLARRLLSVTTDGQVEHVMLHDSIPLSFAPSNALSFAVGDQLNIGAGYAVAVGSEKNNSDKISGISTSGTVGKSNLAPLPSQAGSESLDVLEDDPAVAMARRAVLGYALDPGYKNK